MQPVADLYFPRRLGKLGVRLNATQFAGFGGDGPSLEKSCGPQVLIDSQDYNIARRGD